MKYDMEAEAKKAMAEWDNQHTSGDTCDTPDCPDCGEPMTSPFDFEKSISTETLSVYVKEFNGKLGTVVELPSNETAALLFLLSIVETMAMAAEVSYEEVLGKLATLKSRDALHPEIMDE